MKGELTEGAQSATALHRQPNPPKEFPREETRSDDPGAGSHANACLDALIKQVSSDAPPADSWNLAHKTLEALPLATEEAAVMRNRLANAQNYLETGERGAARYELRLLACSLANK